MIWKTVWKFLKKCTIELLYDQDRHHISGYLSKIIENRVSKRYLYVSVHSSIIHSSLKVDRILMSMYTHIIEYYSLLRRKKF
jgi:hypothetical protein